METRHNGETYILKPGVPKSRRPINHGRCFQTALNKSCDNSGDMDSTTESSSDYDSDNNERKFDSSYITSDSQTDITEEHLLDYNQLTPNQTHNLIKRKSRSNESPKTWEQAVNIKHSRNDSYTDPSSSCKNLLLKLIGIVLCFFCVVYIGLEFHNKNDSDTEFQMETSLHTLKETMDHIRKTFNEQDPQIWDAISSGLTDVIEQPDQISIFILLSKENDTMDCLAASLGQLSGRVLGTNDYLTLTPVNIGNDTGKVLSALKEKIVARKVVVVQNLLHMNANAVQAFHNLCDRENPLIEQTVYIITILSENYEGKRPLPFVEALISNKLSGSVDQDKIAPLVTRITDGFIINVNPQQHMTKCMLNQ